MAELPASTQRYLAERTPEGERNAALFAAACQFRDAIATLGDTERALVPCAMRDGLSEAEARKAIRSAFKGSRREPIRHRFMDRGGQVTAPAIPQRNGDGHPRPAKAIARRFSEPAAAAALPEAREGLMATYLHFETAYGPEEQVAVCVGSMGEDGRDHPAGAGQTRTRDEWLALLASGIDPWPREPGAGVFVRINPMLAGGKTDSDVAAFRHALLEWDDLPIERQWPIIRHSRIPCTAVINSGGRSLHAWVRVDAKGAEEYRERVAALHEFFADCAPCAKNKNPSRFSRLAGVARGAAQQRLLATNIGARSWSEWEAEANSRLPRIVDASELLAHHADEPEPPVLVAGVLHQGSKMVIGGGSKSYKTWALTDLAASVASGSPWWGLETTQARVLYINFEIQPFFYARRLGDVVTAKICPVIPGTLDVWNLRGHAASLDSLMPEIIARVRHAGYGLIIIDPIYKGLGGRDENRAGDVAELLNEVERLATQTGAAVVFGAHFSKGNQSGKQAMDRIGGSGVFARDPDSILTLTPHEEPFCYTVEATLRNFPHLEPFVLRWHFPLFQPVSLDAGKLKRAGRPEAVPATEVLERLSPDGMTPKAWLAAVQEVHELSRASFYRILEKLTATNQVSKSEGGLYVRTKQ
ncbi:MAG TPA: AAA family ATPase [Verrucomicrobiae bacterium]|nr:AAA family ATPase [Verrucomicrobiae bacterium]